MGDGIHRSEDPINSIKVLREHREYTVNRKNYNKHTYKHKTQQIP